jgi:threonine aldolase
MRQVGVLAAAGIVAVETMVERLTEDHARARRLAEGLARVPGITIDLARVQTNMVYAGVGDAGVFRDALRADGVLVNAVGSTSVRFVTHADLREGDVERAVAAAERVASTLAAVPA